MKLQSAVLYLASFMARANFVPVGLVSDCLSSLLSYANEYITQVGADTPYSRSILRSSSANSSVPFDLKSVASTISTSESLTDLEKAAAITGTISGPTRTTSGDSNGFYAEFDDMGRRSKAALASTLSRHETFFCCMQAASYVLCFYGTDLAETIKNDNTSRRHWERAMTCELNPLKYCLESVRGEFVRLAQHVNMFAKECWRMLPAVVDGHHVGDVPDEDIRSRSTSIVSAGVTSDSAGAGIHSMIGAVCTIPMDPVPRLSDQQQQQITPAQVIPRTTSTGSMIAIRSKADSSAAAIQKTKVPVMGTGNNPLESFFPFDPCLLRKMHRSVDGSYRSWRGVPGLDPGAEFDYDHDDRTYEDEDEEDDDNGDMQVGSYSRSHAGIERSYTMSSNASSSLASESDGMILGTTPGAGSLQYPNSYLAELANQSSNDTPSSNAGIAFNNSSGNGGPGSGLNSGGKFIREGILRHGSQTSQTSNLSHFSHEDTSVGAGASDSENREGVSPLPRPRPRLYSVASTGSW